MKLSRIFERLTNDTLTQLSIGGIEQGAINLPSYPQFIVLTNGALLDLYTRFSLMTRELTLQMQEGIAVYNLTSDFAESNTASSEPVKYIIDATTIHKFTDNIISIETVFNELGVELPLNDLNNELSVFTPSATELQITSPNPDNMLSLIYKAAPDIISPAELDPANVEVPIPYHFLDAITAHIAWKIYTPMSTGETNTGNIYRANYLAAVKLIDDTGALIKEVHTNQRFHTNGWI